MKHLAIMKELSLTIQKSDVTVDYIVEKIESAKINLKKTANDDTLSKTISQNVDQVGGGIRYHSKDVGFYCQERMGTRNSDKEDKLLNIKHAAKKVISETIRNIEERFDDMLSPVESSSD